MTRGGIKFVMCFFSSFFLFAVTVSFRFFLFLFYLTDFISLFMSVNCYQHRGVVLAYKLWVKSDTTTTTTTIPSKIEVSR